MWTDLRTVDLAGQRVFLRADLNVPLSEGAITDDSRIVASLETLTYLLERECEVVLASHLGRPKGLDPQESLAPVAADLSERLGREVPLIADYASHDPFAKGFPGSKLVLLENLRYHEGEAKNDAGFAKQLASLAALYVDDAFGTAHRPAASIVGITEYLPSYPGFLLFKEVEELGRLLQLGIDDRPFVVLIGGAKVSDKLPVLTNLLKVAEILLIGGAMANTFIKAQEGEVGASLVEEEMLGPAADLLNGAEMRGKLVFLPDDVVIGTSLEGPAEGVAPADTVPAGKAAFDIGPETIEKYADILSDANTIFWNGPVGVFENPAFAAGTLAMAEACAEADAHVVAGGGDSLAAIAQSGVGEAFDHLSTGGGASLELLSGLELPGVRALKESHSP